MSTQEQHFNALHPNEAERLAMLSSTLAGVQLAISKIQLHGYDSYDPRNPSKFDEHLWTNRNQLGFELGKLQDWMNTLEEMDDIMDDDCARGIKHAQEHSPQYLHHNQ